MCDSTVSLPPCFVLLIGMLILAYSSEMSIAAGIVAMKVLYYHIKPYRCSPQ